MLDLINKDRAANDLGPVILGHNTAAQAHAEEMLAYGFGGHWGLDGLKPYMRYTLAGGTGREGENVLSQRRLPGAEYDSTPPDEALTKAQGVLMDSPGHRRNILDPLHQSVNLGIACDHVGCFVTQQFESNHVSFDELPTINERGVLGFSGKTLNGFSYKSASVWYDLPPLPLLPSQIELAHCYSLGVPIAFVVKPLPPGNYYPNYSTPYEYTVCHDPITLEGIQPSSVRVHGFVFREIPSRDEDTTVAYRVASSYRVGASTFAVKVNLCHDRYLHGPGVYTVLIWGEKGTEAKVLTNYSIFITDTPEYDCIAGNP